MKNNKSLIIVAIILLNVLVIFMVGQSFLGNMNEYDKAVKQARELAEQDLCGKSIDKYNEAAALDNNAELRIEMLDVYQKGIESGEISNIYNVVSEVTLMVDTFQKDISVYESACDFLIKYEKYEECANILKQAAALKLSSDKLDKALETIRYKYAKYFAMYTGVQPMCDDMFTVLNEDGTYGFLNNEASPELDGGYVSASSFSEGYAYIKILNLDGTENSIVIDKEGKRLFYLDGVESSSGVGKAFDKSNNQIYLLSCKVGNVYKYYDANGKVAFGEYAFAGRFRNNVAAVKESDGTWKLINGEGKPISDKKFKDVILNEFDECAPKGLIIAKESDKYHIYQLDAEKYTIKQVGDFSCDGAKAFVDEYAAFKSGDLWGFVGADGKVIIDAQYEDAKSFSNKMGAIKTNGMWSFINPNNEVVIEETFEDVSYLSGNGICFAKSDGYWSYLKMYYTNN